MFSVKASSWIKLVPLAVFLLFSTIAVVLWQHQYKYEQELVMRHMEASAEQIQIRVMGLMNARMAALELLADRWVERHPSDFSQERFLQFAENFYEYYPGFAGINWIDPQGYFRWVFPEKTNGVALVKKADEHPDPRYRAAFEKAKQGLGYAVTACLELYQGGIGFESFWPLIYEGKVQGYLNGVFQVNLIMATCLGKEILEHFIIRIYEGDDLIYTPENQAVINLKPNRMHTLREILFRGKVWQLDLEPNPTVYSPARSLHFHDLFFGLGVSAILSLLLYLLINQMEMYREARDQALHEVNERKRAEEVLRKNEKKLEALVAEVAAKNVELEAFVYTVSHDLKTPIVTIDGFIGALKEDFGNILPQEGEEYLRYISDAARKMESLINDLLDLSRIGRLSEKKASFPFVELVQDALETLQPQIKARGIVVNVSEDLPVIYGEKKRLGQVVDNLLANAVKYIGKDNPSPRIVVGVQEQEGQETFFVRDNGIGIEEKYFDTIFQIFQRLPSAKKLGEGTGIGLTIVKRIVENHRGRVWVTSEPGKGSTFFFTLNEGT